MDKHRAHMAGKRSVPAAGVEVSCNSEAYVAGPGCGRNGIRHISGEEPFSAVFRAQGHLDPQATSPSRDADGSYNKRLLKGYVDMSGGNPQTLTLSEIPYAQYDIYVYLSAGTANREGYATDGTSTFYFRTGGSGVSSGDNAVLIQATETSDLPVNATATFARFTNLTGSSKSITVSAAGNAGIAGFQMVEILD